MLGLGVPKVCLRKRLIGKIIQNFCKKSLAKNVDKIFWQKMLAKPDTNFWQNMTKNGQKIDKLLLLKHFGKNVRKIWQTILTKNKTKNFGKNVRKTWQKFLEIIPKNLAKILRF